MKCAWLVLALGCGPIYPAATPTTQQPSDPTYGQPGYNYGQSSSGYGNGQSTSGYGQPPPANGGYGQQPGYGPPTGNAPDPSGGPGGGPPGSVPPAPAPPPSRAAPPPRPAPNAVAQAMVDAHNKRRGKHCAPPLTWSPQLADVAQRWAASLRDQGCKFGHSGGQYGENLAAGSTGSLDAEAVVAMWYDEIKDFSFKGGGFSMQTGHFTQVVWRATSQVGCGTVNCNGMDIWVCEYDPAGNVEGEYRQNVISGADCR